MTRQTVRGVYAITPDSDDTAKLVRSVKQCLLGGVRLIQYRNKTASMPVRTEQAAQLALLCRHFGAVYIVNDDVDLARSVNADGVHIGRHDGSIEHARHQLGPKKLVGVSCYDELALACSAVAAGADYVAFGSVFPSLVKAVAVRAPLQLLTQAKASLAVPIVGIGGIVESNAPSVIEAGADAVAVISGLFQQSSIEDSARALCSLFGPA